MKILLLNIYKLSLFSVSPCRQLNSKPVYFVWTGAYTALLQAAPLPRCDAGGEGRKGGGHKSWRGDSTRGGGWQHILHKVWTGRWLEVAGWDKLCYVSLLLASTASQTFLLTFYPTLCINIVLSLSLSSQTPQSAVYLQFLSHLMTMQNCWMFCNLFTISNVCCYLPRTMGWWYITFVVAMSSRGFLFTDNVIFPNQLEKLEAAKAAWLVCLCLTLPYFALLSLT